MIEPFGVDKLPNQAVIDLHTALRLSMIPHQSDAILMCREVPITDNEIKDLCNKITLGQQGEIDQMMSKLGSAT